MRDVYLIWFRCTKGKWQLSKYTFTNKAIAQREVNKKRRLGYETKLFKFKKDREYA